MLSNLIAIPFALGEASNGLVAFLLPDWISFQYTVAFLCGLPLLTWCFVPESPRWLLERRLADRAEELLRHIARQNKGELPLLHRLPG